MLITSEHQRGHSLPKPFLYVQWYSLPPFVFLSFIFSLALLWYPFLSLSLFLSLFTLYSVLLSILFLSLLFVIERIALSLALNLRFSFSSVFFSFCHCFRDPRFLDVPSRFLSSCCDFLLDSLAESSLILLLDSLPNSCFRTSETLISPRTLRFPIFSSVAKIYNFGVFFSF